MARRAPIELWGGLECTVARIGDDFRDQLTETGHRGRDGDLERIRALGIRTVRFPVLWETVSPESPEQAKFGWADFRLRQMRELGLKPIVGLIHHGSGPRYTNLLDPDFPRLFARHAARVARRYPWIELFTPVNEPLTTARFSALYGHWYPHARDEGSFLRALVAQCRATLLAMRAIRRVNPHARLVQTEDLGRTFSTPSLAPQAAYENERRWLTFDLLFGRVDRHHPWWAILRDRGVSERHLRSFLDGEAKPDVVGVNHYLTSERFLDERLERYPAHLAGGNGREAYADVEAVRTRLPPGVLGPAARLRETWERYGAPIAITEAHHGCTRDEQVRWLDEVWRAASDVRREGADIRAVTVWSLFGTVDWNSLLTRRDGIYEPGAFDIRGPEPRPTALATAAAALARTGRITHPVLGVPGWWRRPDRWYDPQDRGHEPDPPPGPTILVLGPDDAWRSAMAEAARRRGLHLQPIEAGRADAVAEAIADLEAGRSWAVLDLQEEGELARLPLAKACRDFGRAYLLFGPAEALGRAAALPATEADPAKPDTARGRAALERETFVTRECLDALVIRTGAIFGPHGPDGYVATLMSRILVGRPVARDRTLVSPTYLPDLCHVALDLLIDGETGIRHVFSGTEPRDAFAQDLARRLGREIVLGEGVDDEPPPPALATVRGELMPPLASALDRFLAHDHVRGLADPKLAIAAE